MSEQKMSFLEIAAEVSRMETIVVVSRINNLALDLLLSAARIPGISKGEDLAELLAHRQKMDSHYADELLHARHTHKDFPEILEAIDRLEVAYQAVGEAIQKKVAEAAKKTANNGE